MKTNRKVLVSNLLLLLAAVIWGGALVAQTVGAGYVGPWSFIFSRFALAAVVLAPISLLAERRYAGKTRTPRKQMLLGGACCGLLLGLASVAQQAGVPETSAGKAGFITALYVVLVPLLSLILGKRPKNRIWFCAALGLLGLYLVSVKEGFSVGAGDALMMLCAVIFSGQILCVAHFSRRVDNLLGLATVEFLTAALVGLIGMLLFEQPRWESFTAAWLPIVYAGVLSSALGYSLQILGEKHTDPAVATLLMSLEAVFSALAGWLFLHQVLSLRELIGCALIFAAVVLAQI